MILPKMGGGGGGILENDSPENGGGGGFFGVSLCRGILEILSKNLNHWKKLLHHR